MMPGDSGGMDILLVALGIRLPILKFVLFPARTMGRGGNWTIMGALMIVGLMMALWFGMQSLSGNTAPGDNADATATAAQSSEIAALEKLL